MFKQFIPKQDGFFKLFQETSDCLVNSATSFKELFHNPEDQKQVDFIASYEEQGDQLTYNTFQLLHQTFITPFDRHDIHDLASGLDDILDLINRCAQRFPFYKLSIVTNELIELADLSLQSCILVKSAVYLLHDLHRAEEIFKYCKEINALESKAHKAVISGERCLFLEDNDFKTFFKLKDTYTRTKLVINGCQDVANMIKSIVLEYS